MLVKDTHFDFKGQKIFIGIDVHLRNWSVTLRTRMTHIKTFSMNPSPEQLHRHLVQNYPGGTYYSVYEAGFCGFWVHRSLLNLGIHNIVINPADVPTTHKEKRRRRDPVDSSKLSRELASGNLTGIYVPKPSNEYLRSLCRLYSKSVVHQTRLKNRIRSFLHQNGISIPSRSELCPWTHRFIEWISSLEFDQSPAQDYMRFCILELLETRKLILDIVRKLRNHIQESSARKIVYDYLMSVPGVGFKTAMIFYLEIVNISRFSNFDQLASYTGLVPDVDASGDRETNMGITFRQNRYLRHILIEAAWVAIRKDPALTLKYQELTRRMSKQKSIIRIAKKLVSRMRFVWMHEQTYVMALVQ